MGFFGRLFGMKDEDRQRHGLNPVAPFQETPLPFAAALQCLPMSDPRRQSPEAFAMWAEARWKKLEASGPLAVLPTRVAFAENAWMDTGSNCYAALYPSSPFSDLLDFELFIRYVSSIQQVQISEGRPDLDWFCPETAQEGLSGYTRDLANRQRLWSPQEIVVEVKRWELPNGFGWMADLSYQGGFIFVEDNEAALTASASEGFLSFFAVDG